MSSRSKSPANPEAAALDRALVLLSRGETSKARSVLLSHGLADLCDPAFAQQIADKHPPMRDPMQSLVSDYGDAGSDPLELPTLLPMIRTLRRNRALGQRNEFLSVLGAPDAEEFERLRSGLQPHGDKHLSGRT